MKDECPICLETKPLINLVPCGHTICPQCTHKLLHISVLCPICRTTCYNSYPPLVTFDINKNHDIHEIVLKKKRGKYGITLTQNNNEIIIYNTEKHVKNIKVNDILLSLNNIPCYNKSCAIEILRLNMNHKLCVLRKKK